MRPLPALPAIALALTTLLGCQPAATAPTAPAALPAMPAPAAAAARFGLLTTVTPPPCLAKPVLLVLADRHFFYREYAEPRARLEHHGYRVVVASAAGELCYPHLNSGQGADRGTVQADLALSRVRADDYAAIVFAGGWGAAAYQFAVPHRYEDPRYNGSIATRGHVNLLIDWFARQRKQIVGICHGVTVLGWARRDGESPLKGRPAAASAGDAPRRVGQVGPLDLSRTEVIAQGACVPAPSALGDPASAHDDVVVSDHWITAQDDRTAAYAGDVLAREIYHRPGTGAWIVRDGLPSPD